MQLENKRIIVTGSASGMGAGTLRSYVKAGANVIAMDTQDDLGRQVAHRYMKASGGGSIINFGSISGQRPEPSAASYSTAKGAVHS